MKRLLLMLFLMILPVSALADAAVPPPGDATARRLEALRYTLSPAVSLTEADMQALLKNDLFDAPLKPSDLFETDADFGPTDPTANPPRSADFPDAVSLDRDEAFLLLTPGSAYTLTEEARPLVRDYIAEESADQESFGNGRGVRNIFENIIVAQNNRLAKLETVTREALMEITADDILHARGKIDEE